jgi:predicted Zn-dependent protease
MSRGVAEIMSGRWFRVFAAGVLIFGAGCVGAVRDPGLGALVSDEEELARAVELERQAARYRWHQQVRLEGILMRLLLGMPDPPPVTTEVVPCDAVNAFVGGGKVYVCLGLLHFVQSDDELAVILGHELGHLPTSAEHGLIGRGRADEERAADIRGFLYAHRAGYDIRRGAGVFERMAVELSPDYAEGHRRRHPSHAERVVLADKIARLLQGDAQVTDPTMLLERLSQHLKTSGNLP